MIVNWTKDNLKVIPAHVPTKLDPSATSRFCTLGPGYNDVPDDLWVEARTFVTDDLAAGRIVEEWKKTPKPDKPEDYPPIWKEVEDGRENKSMYVPANLSDISRPGVIERVVRNTFVLPALQKWSVEENRSDVQKALV